MILRERGIKNLKASFSFPMNYIEETKMKFITLIIFITFLSSCNKFHFNSGGFSDSQKNNDPAEGQTRFLDIKEIEDLDFSEIAKKAKGKNFFTKCSSYDEGPNSFRLSNLLPSQPFKKLENCFSKAINESVGELCRQEKILNDLEDEYSNDEEALYKIEEARYQLDDTKEEVIDHIYTIADSMDEIHEKVDDNIEENVNDDLLQGFLNLLTNTELGGFTSFFERTANSLCNFDVISQHKNRDKGEQRRDNNNDNSDNSDNRRDY